MKGYILVVDDSRAMRMIVKRTIRQAGYGDYPVRDAENGAQALHMIHASPPALVLTDWNMPEMTGIELLGALVRDTKQVPLGFITCETMPVMIERALRGGARFVLGKPFTVKELEERLGDILFETPELAVLGR